MTADPRPTEERQWDREDTALGLANTRDDTALKRKEDREDTALGLANTRDDTALKRKEDREDTALGLANTRDDTALKRKEDREDTALGLANTRDDTALKRREDREDTALGLANTRDDTALKRKEDRQDTAESLIDSRLDNDLANEATLLKATYDAYLSVAQGSLDRSLQRATFIITASAAIVSLYTALLGFRFKSDGSGSFPVRGLLPAVFLGAAVLFSTFYVAFLRRSTTTAFLLPSGLGGQIAETRLRTFLEWVFAGVVARSWSLRLAVISLGLGLALLPLPFVQVSSEQFFGIAFGGIGALVAWGIGEGIVARMAPDYAGGPPAVLPDEPPAQEEVNQ